MYSPSTLQKTARASQGLEPEYLAEECGLKWAPSVRSSVKDGEVAAFDAEAFWTDERVLELQLINLWNSLFGSGDFPPQCVEAHFPILSTASFP